MCVLIIAHDSGIGVNIMLPSIQFSIALTGSAGSGPPDSVTLVPEEHVPDRWILYFFPDDRPRADNLRPFGILLRDATGTSTEKSFSS